jgi:hypothetical protein
LRETISQRHDRRSFSQLRSPEVDDEGTGRNASGGFFFLIDSDLEEEPEWLSEFAELVETKCVYVVQVRKGGAFERWSGRMVLSWFQALDGDRSSQGCCHREIDSKMRTESSCCPS